MKLISWLALTLLGACSRGSYGEEIDDSGGGTGNTAGSPATGGKSEPLPRDTSFELKPEFSGPCEKATVVDVNLGNAPEAFVRAAHCQITGSEPDAALVETLSNQLRTVNHTRRVDAVRSICQTAGRACSLSYSDPWQAQVDLTAACQRKGTRDLGAVLMYWSECPGMVNCGMNWANTHAPGMASPSPLLAFGGGPDGYYAPSNAGFWRRELLDARWAGLQFLLLNTFGPDMVQLPRVVEALASIGGGIQVALFDDTWGWGRGVAPYNQLPDFNDPEAAAQLIYQKWQQFYRVIPSEHWYRHQGRPLIAFYNAGTLKPENQSAAALSRVRELFKAEFGEDPFLAIDRAFFQDPNMPNVADSEFRWNTFSNNAMSQSSMRGVTFAHFMTKWDSIGRDKSGSLATPEDRLVKGPELLDQYLQESAGANLAMIATWNDLGEGTGITRNYDYYYRGEWLPPNEFMSRIRASQCE
jgi:hypothetical protein